MVRWWRRRGDSAEATKFGAFRARFDTSSERGVTFPLVALTAFMLFGFGALGVDAANGYSERRRSQGAVDSATLAGVVQLALDSSATDQDAVDQVLLFADANLPNPIPVADWVACVDSDQLAVTAAAKGLTPATECISWDIDEMRVMLPERQVDTYFAGVIGVDTLNVSAFAHVITHIPGVGGSPPFVVTAGTDGGDEACLRTGPPTAIVPPRYVGNGVGPLPVNEPGLGDETDPLDSDPCDFAMAAPSVFGTLNPYIYQDRDPAMPDFYCKQPGSTVLDVSIAAGIDHNLSAFGDYLPGEPEAIDGNGCPGGPAQSRPNTMKMQTGFTAAELKDGLLDGTTFDSVPYPGRLQIDTPYYPSGRSFAGRQLENTPLWAFINTSASGICGTVRDAYTANNPAWDYFDLKEGMIACIKTWAGGIVFTESIADSSRFAFIPLLDEATLPGPPTLVHFNAFVPVYIQTLYQDGNKVGSPDPLCFSQHPAQPGNKGWYRHDAGQPFDCGRPNQNVDRMSSIVINCGMLPSSLCIPDPAPGGPPGGTPVLIIELVK